MKNETFKNNLMTYIFAAVLTALALTAVVIIFRMVYEPPEITVNVDVELPTPAPVTAEPQTRRSEPIEVDLLSAEISLVEMPEVESAAIPEIPHDEIMALAKTLKGECYDNEHDDMRRVAWTVVNRVDSPDWCNDVISVITRPGQFHGYRPGNVPTEDNVRIAEEVLSAWYGGDYSMREELFGGMIAMYFASRAGESVNRYREG